MVPFVASVFYENKFGFVFNFGNKSVHRPSSSGSRGSSSIISSAPSDSILFGAFFRIDLTLLLRDRNVDTL